MALIAAGISIAIGVLWLWLGDWIVRAVDRVFPGPPSTIAYGDMLITADSFALGMGYPFPRSDGSGKTFFLDPQCRLVLRMNGRTFTLGPVKTRWSDEPDPQYLFIPDPGDAVSLTKDVSRLSWHTPFVVNFMGGYMPRSHRYAYYRLRWKKSSGATLEITWRDQQGFDKGWQDEYNYRLMSVKIR
jgi:hypothetical protein